MLAALVESGRDPRPLLGETAALSDPEPFVRLLVFLSTAGRVDGALAAVLVDLLAVLPDAALQHLLAEDALSPMLAQLLPETLRRWDLARLTALALVVRWLRRAAPEVAVSLFGEHEALLHAPPDDRAGRALSFASGPTLLRLARDPLWAAPVERSVARAIAVLAHAPKSISQANAERLLSRRVYADPGHFFFELLQNADDAGATRFSVSVRETEIALRHDGAPFSILDLVGVLSIGQTTKSEEQIGFFGVGFKSVYEVTDRPRVHSGALSFEIAHVSIPRAVRAPDASAHGDTVLVLPRSRQMVDASTLFGRASAIPPETLMTLAHVRALMLEGPAGERLAWRVSQDEAQTGVLVLSGSSGHEPSGPAESGAAGRGAGESVRRYRIVRREAHFEGPRPEGRARRSTVLVAAALDPQGLPSPVQGATLYAFLPTAERTGLRVLIHARFDVTLDRERLELDSAWNEHLLREAGLALGALAASLSGEAGLSLLSRGAELSPAVRGLHQASIEALRDVAFLRGAGGERLSPSRAALASPELAQALAGVSLPEERRTLAPLPPREAEVALELGAQRFGPAELFRFCAERLRVGAPAPLWLGTPTLSALAEAPVDDGALAQLPVLVDAEGKLLAPSRAEVAAPVCVALYAGWRDRAVLVDEGTLEVLPAALRARLAVPRFELATLVSDLKREGPRASLLERESLLFVALESLDPSLVPELLTIQFVPTMEGTRAAPSQLRRLSPELAPLLPLLPLLSAQLPFAEASFAARPLGEKLIAVFDRSDLAQALEEGLVLDEVGCDALTELLDRLATSESISLSLARRFSLQPLWDDVHGGPRRALVSKERALVSAGQEVQIVPEWPWLKDPDRPFVRAQSVPLVDAPFLARSLAGGTWPSVPETRIPRVLEHLVRHASELSGAEVEGLARASVWSDTNAVLRPLAALRRGTPSRALDALFSLMGERHVAAPRSLALADGLGLGGRVPQHDHAALVADLSRSRPELDGALDATLDVALQQALVEAASVLSSAELAPLATLPIFADAEGRRLPLGHWRDQGSAPGLYLAGPHRAVLSPGPWSLLSEAQEQALAPLLDALGIEPPTLEEIMARATLLSPAPLLAFALAHAAFLTAAHRQGLAELPLFTNQHGEPRPSSALVLPTDLSGLDFAALGLSDAVASDPSADAMIHLGIPRAELGRLLKERVLGRLVSGATLDTCLPSSIEAFAALSSLCVQAGMDLRDAPLGLDAEGRLARPPLMSPTPSARALLSFQRTSGALRLVEPRYAAALEPLARAALTAPLSPRQILEVLRADPDRVELPRLYAWLLEERESIAADPASLGLLGSAPLFPSQKGERRAPRDLVLDVTVPDLGLGWGLDASVPEALARWLRATFEIDRHARRALVTHLLDGLAALADDDDLARARELLAFLARALGAGECSPAELEERVRRLEVRARLLVPVVDAATGVRRWDKPRFAWSPRDETAARATLFVEDLPPTIVLHTDPLGERDPDPPTLLLLTACGARDDLDDGTVIERLDAMAHLPLGARRALSRYVLVRVHEEPARIERWQLRTRAWVVSGDALFRPSERVWPDPMARALLGEGGAGLFVDAELVRALASLDPASDPAKDTARRLSFRGGSSLTLDEVGAVQRGRVASPELLTWLEAGLTAGPLQGGAVREALIGLRLLDEEGRARPIEELCVRGARSLFGPRRGDWSMGASFPRTARALRIPVEPDAARIAAFLVEVGGLVAAAGVEVGASAGPSDEDALVRSVPHALARLATFADARLPEGAGLAVESAKGTHLARLGDPALSLLSPSSLLSALEDVDGGPLSELLAPLPRSRSPQLETLLLAAGIPDLFSALRITKVSPSSPRPELDEAAETLRRRLAPLAALRAVRRARVCGSLSIEGIVAIGSGVALRVPLEVEGAIEGETLWVTPAALADPLCLAPILCPEPRSRRELAQVLALPKPLTPSTPGSSSARVETLAPPKGLLDRVRRFFGGAPRDEPEARPTVPPKPPRAPSEPLDPGRAVASDRQEREERFFRPTEHLPSQLEGGEGWLAARREVPAFGFAFAPPTLESPWLYAPKMIVTDFSTPSQRWTSPTRRSPTRRTRADDEVGLLVLRGRLPRGENVLPVPHYGHVQSARARASGSGAALRSALSIGPSGTSVILLDEAAELEIRIGLGACPAFGSAAPLSFPEALEPIVPDDELPEEALEFVAALDEDDPAATRAFAIRDFVRRRYRYDPSYLEDPAVGRWLARITRGRPSVHLAALHASRDAKHLGAGVCYELNTMACELMRRAGIPAGLATGWVMSGGSLSEPDHLWAVAFLVDEAGTPLLLPIDASTTREGRPLEVPRRPAPRIRPPTEASSAPRGMTSREENEPMGAPEARPRRAPGRPEKRPSSTDPTEEKRPKKARLPRAELHRVLFHLGQLAGKPLTPEERSEVERALEDPEAAQKLLERLR